jgi:hypothetical protein
MVTSAIGELHSEGELVPRRYSRWRLNAAVLPVKYAATVLMLWWPVSQYLSAMSKANTPIISLAEEREEFASVLFQTLAYGASNTEQSSASGP